MLPKEGHSRRGSSARDVLMIQERQRRHEESLRLQEFLRLAEERRALDRERQETLRPQEGGNRMRPEFMQAAIVAAADDYLRLLEEEAQMIIEGLHILANDLLLMHNPSVLGVVQRFFETSVPRFPIRYLILTGPFRLLNPAKWLLWGYVVVRRRQNIFYSYFLIFHIDSLIFVGVTLRMICT